MHTEINKLTSNKSHWLICVFNVYSNWHSTPFFLSAIRRASLSFSKNPPESEAPSCYRLLAAAPGSLNHSADAGSEYLLPSQPSPYPCVGAPRHGGLFSFSRRAFVLVSPKKLELSCKRIGTKSILTHSLKIVTPEGWIWLEMLT